jgi:DNA-binding winged helix-turn-helix (wHTH) protein
MAEPDPARRELLARTDALLDRVEELRLRDATRVPAGLGDAINRTANSMGLEASAPPATLGAAHCYLLRLQGVLLAGWTRARAEAARTAQVKEPVADGDVPRVALPRRNRSRTEGEWRDAVQWRVQRAHDAARYLNAQSAAAAVGSDDQLAVLRRAQADSAQYEFEQLRVDADQLLGRPVTVDAESTLHPRGRLELDDLVIDFDFQGVLRRGQRVKLGPVEFDILAGLVGNRGRVVTREALMHLVYGDDPTMDIGSRRIDVHLAHVRAKVGGLGFLETVRGTGWRVANGPGGRTSDKSDQIRQERREARRAWARRDAAEPRPQPPQPLPGPDRWSVKRLR